MNARIRTYSEDALPRWLTLAEAVRYSGTGKDLLLKLARSGEVRGGRRRDKKTADWFFDRLSIDDYMESMLLDEGIEQKVIDFLERL